MRLPSTAEGWDGRCQHCRHAALPTSTVLAPRQLMWSLALPLQGHESSCRGRAASACSDVLAKANVCSCQMHAAAAPSLAHSRQTGQHRHKRRLVTHRHHHARAAGGRVAGRKHTRAGAAHSRAPAWPQVAGAHRAVTLRAERAQHTQSSRTARSPLRGVQRARAGRVRTPSFSASPVSACSASGSLPSCMQHCASRYRLFASLAPSAAHRAAGCPAARRSSMKSCSSHWLLATLNSKACACVVVAVCSCPPCVPSHAFSVLT